MKKTIEPGATPATYHPEALYAKAERYIQNMDDYDSDEWEYALWSSFSLEFLARAALANVSPALLAEADKNGSNLLFALGFAPFEERFSPRSIPISEVFKRLSGILPEFTKEHESFGVVHTGKRNAELHSGELAFDGVKGSTWQPRFYQTCAILLTSMGVTLPEFVGEDEAEVAKKLIDAADDESAKAVKGDVEAHKKVWNAKLDDDRSTLQTQAAVWATRQNGHRVDCPSCGSAALVLGEPVSAPTQKLDDDEIIETQEYLPTHFECVACGLKIAGLSRLAVVGLSDRYKKTQTYDAAEYYAPADDWSNYEDDNNER
ncbi:hypothetical protein CO731_01848 [Aminobacter sp. MSH1]|jgi:hypothetical protein|uniref:hypothetical protein n=1 Tax=Hyphomicrobiales TaxID=356 RepID=UPI00069A5C0C|nr:MULTISPECIES: hypothetical protein [Hyphomicrobiales]AWC22390.1 hypothetical protein CO731_01848 [Aminobacter sp. MSH1]KNY33305.1 hypothetical protein AKG12_16245 [Agrobacterium sp. SUL3]MBP2149750.1 hypothetical protein [Xanthobacter flavus]